MRRRCFPPPFFFRAPARLAAALAAVLFLASPPAGGQEPAPEAVAASAPVTERLPDTRVGPCPGPRARVRGADEPLRIPRGEAWDTWGHALLRVEQVDPFPLDDLGTPFDDGQTVRSRAIVGAAWQPHQRLCLAVELDVANGLVAGDRTDLGQASGQRPFRVDRSGPDDLRRVFVRKAYASYDTDVARLLIGAQTFGWGTGMLANDGHGDPHFGDAWRGSLVLRAAALTQPWRNRADAGRAARGTTLLVAGDRVLEDDNASWSEGDDAWSAIVGARVDTLRYSVGGFHALRFQRDRLDPFHPPGERTRVFAATTDVYARVTLLRTGQDGQSAAHQLSLETEGALILGSTDRPWLDETFEDGARIQSMGGLARLRWDHDPRHLSAFLEAGYAGGDNDPRDRVVRTFHFHTDYNVGLVLFDHVLPLLHARAADRVFDPTLLAVPPGGTRFTIPQGGVNNAAYVNPVVRWRPVAGVDLRAGWLLAGAVADMVDLYQTARNGGFNADFGGRAQGPRLLGQEFNFSARYTLRNSAQVHPTLGLEGGALLPGNALAALNEGAGMPTVWVGRALLDLRW
jgi:hypothetical protein